jgi:hypothetical protein
MFMSYLNKSHGDVNGCAQRKATDVAELAVVQAVGDVNHALGIRGGDILNTANLSNKQTSHQN